MLEGAIEAGGRGWEGGENGTRGGVDCGVLEQDPDVFYQLLGVGAAIIKKTRREYERVKCRGTKSAGDRHGWRGGQGAE